MEKGQTLVKCLSENSAPFLAYTSMHINTFTETGTLYQILSKRMQGRKQFFQIPNSSHYSFATSSCI